MDVPKQEYYLMSTNADKFVGWVASFGGVTRDMRYAKKFTSLGLIEAAKDNPKYEEEDHFLPIKVEVADRYAERVILNEGGNLMTVAKASGAVKSKFAGA